jgi:hypothetical protein
LFLNFVFFLNKFDADIVEARLAAVRNFAERLPRMCRLLRPLEPASFGFSSSFVGAFQKPSAGGEP